MGALKAKVAGNWVTVAQDGAVAPLVYANAAARNAAHPSPTNGTTVFLLDVKQTQVFVDGTWYIDALSVNVPRVKGGSGLYTADGGGFFTIAHGAGYTPTWAQITIANTDAVAMVGKVNITGLDATIIGCVLIRTTTGVVIGSNQVTLHWTVGAAGANV